MSRVRCIVAAACLLLAGLAYAAPTSAAAAAALPSDRLHFGVTNEPTDLSWMTSSGVPWKYRYQYLSAGVNTGGGWETWNQPAGQFATYYMDDSGNNGYIPVFTYYELLQSNPSTGSNESDRDFSNLNNTSTMAAYYSNFTLLMQKAAAYGRQVVVHVEPDLWGYLQQRAAGGGPQSLSASVASSGNGDLSGYPNTVQGFAYALLHLRDKYAPNVTMAIHASMWSGGADVASSTDPSLNVVGIADSTGSFLDQAGVGSNPNGSTWDAIFHDVDDHDAGWWEATGSTNAGFTHWWDPTNQRFPNFARYLSWVGELHARTGKQQVAWQVPVGNQYFLTENNTCGHYQDNVAQYFMGHVSDLTAAGIAAVLYGAGNACQTTNTDSDGDGIFNAGGKVTTDLAGFCNACNTHVATVADDDGGYLRMAVGQYYANATPSPSPTATATPTPTPRPSPTPTPTGAPTPTPTPVTVTQPGSPTNVVAVPALGQAVVSWTPPLLSGGSPITAYAVYAYPRTPTVIAIALTPTYVFPGLTSGQYYTFTVTAWNGHYWSAWSQWSVWVKAS